MRVFFLLIFSLFLLSGCGSQEGGQEEVVPEENLTASKEETETPAEESLEDLLQEVDIKEQLEAACGELKVELTTAYLEKGQERPAIVGFCHSDGYANLEGEPSYLAVASYVKETKEWNVDLRENEFILHPTHVAGILELDDGTERVVIGLASVPAAFGSTSAIVISSQDHNQMQIERINSTVTQFGEFRTDGNQLIIEDDFNEEIFTYHLDEVTHTTQLKEVETGGDLVITYNKTADDTLVTSLESESVLNVKPGDIISFRPEQPLNLVDFQIRTSMRRVPDEPETFKVTEADIGETIDLGEYPYNDMIRFYIGDPYVFTSQAYLEQLKKGIMPGSKVQLTTPNSEIPTIMADEFLISEFGWSGAKHLQYERFTYAIPFLEEEGDIIYSVIRTLPFGTHLTGDDFIKGWGQPTHTMVDMDSMEEAIIMTYEFDTGHYVHVYLDGNSTSSRANSIHLF